MQPFREQVGYFDVVKVGEREMGITMYTDLRQVYDRCVSSMAVDRLGP